MEVIDWKSSIISGINLELMMFITFAFLFGLIVIIILVFGLFPLNSKAAVAKGREPEKMNTVYLRLIMYIFAMFIAWVTDVFLIAVSKNYTVPMILTAVFILIIFYKLVFVLFKDFKDLGFNSRGIIETAKIATKVISTKNIDALLEEIDSESEKNVKNEDTED